MKQHVIFALAKPPHLCALSGRYQHEVWVMFVMFIYIVCLGVGLLFTLITAFAGHVFGGGHDGAVTGSHGQVEAGADGSDMPGVSAFSPTVISTFVGAFGGLGIIFTQISATKNPLISAPLSLLGALAIASVVLWILRQLFRHTQGSSESKVSSVVGCTASLITPICANGVGEIAYVQGGTRYTAPARSERGNAIIAGQNVKITRVVGSQFYVVPE